MVLRVRARQEWLSRVFMLFLLFAVLLCDTPLERCVLKLAQREAVSDCGGRSVR